MAPVFSTPGFPVKCHGLQIQDTIYFQFTNPGYDILSVYKSRIWYIFSLQIQDMIYFHLGYLYPASWLLPIGQTLADKHRVTFPVPTNRLGDEYDWPGKALASCPTPVNASTAGEALIRRCCLLTCLNIKNYIIVTLNCNISLPFFISCRCNMFLNQWTTYLKKLCLIAFIISWY